MIAYIAASIVSLLIIGWCLIGIFRKDSAVTPRQSRKRVIARTAVILLIANLNPLINYFAAKNEPIPNSVRVALANVGIGKTIREVEMKLGPLQGPFPGSLEGTQEWRYDLTPSWSLTYRKYAVYTERNGRIVMAGIRD